MRFYLMGERLEQEKFIFKVSTKLQRFLHQKWFEFYSPGKKNTFQKHPTILPNIYSNTPPPSHTTIPIQSSHTLTCTACIRSSCTSISGRVIARNEIKKRREREETERIWQQRDQSSRRIQKG